MVTFRLAPARLPPGRRIYAVGDVHGMARPLAVLHRRIAQDLARRPVGSALVVYLGDFLDRGPESAEVLGLLAAGSPVSGAAMIALRGNHEAMALSALSGASDDEACVLWLQNGARASLASWGVDARSPCATWRAAIPEGQLDLLEHLALTYREGGYLFVHAGLRPLVPIALQDPQDLIWIREPFLSYDGDFGAVIVHGHTPSRTPIVRRNRIGIDTGCVYGGSLTALILEEDRLAFLEVGADP